MNAKIASQSSLDLETISKKQTLIDMYPNVVLTQGQKSACRFVNGSIFVKIWTTDFSECTLVGFEFLSLHVLNQ